MRERLRTALSPREGWLSLLLVVIMLLALAWSIQRAGWLDALDYLVPVVLWAALIGTVLALSRLSVMLTMPLAAIAGGWVVLTAVGSEYFPELDLSGQLLTLRSETIDWARILIDGGTGPQQAPWAIGLGMLLWASGLIAAYTLYRHHRTLDTILLLGALLLVNLSATFADLLGYLVLFCLAALLLWLRASLVARQQTWEVRHVTQTGDVPSSIMRSGVSVILATVALAWLLTGVAVAAPLTGLLNSLDPLWSDFRGDLDAIFGGLGTAETRWGGTGFATRMTVSGTWTGGDGEVMLVGSQRPYYLRTITYDRYTGHGWDSTGGPERSVPTGSRIFPGATPERPYAPDAFELETITITLQAGLGRTIFTPGYPASALLPVVVTEPNGLPFLGQLEAASVVDIGRGYQITAYISRATEAQLMGAGRLGAETEYPAAVAATYLDTTGVTQRTVDQARALAQSSRRTDTYSWAKAIASWLNRDPRFRYDFNGTLPSDPNQDLVDFFLFDPDGQVGYCEYYASAMAIMARSLGIPARVAVGYAPGEPVEAGVYQVRQGNAHAWAELYFPGYGWQIFEATKTIPPVVRQSGGNIPRPIPGAVTGVEGPNLFEEGLDPGRVSPLASFQPTSGGVNVGEDPNAGQGSGANGLILLAALVALLLAGAWRWLRIRRRFRFLSPADVQWQRLALAADRAGVGRRPSETIYEYAGWLEGQLPAHRAEIRDIANGKVEQSYSGRWVAAEVIERLERAWRRLQLPLLGLAIRRRLRGLLTDRA